MKQGKKGNIKSASYLNLNCLEMLVSTDFTKIKGDNRYKNVGNVNDCKLWVQSQNSERERKKRCMITCSVRN